jgi:hypothetical protein
MAEMEWTRPVPARAARPMPEWLQKLSNRYLDWEDALTLALLLGATVSVAATLEAGGWSKQMPALTLVSVLAILAAHVLSSSRLPALLAWPSSIVIGAMVVFWQTLIMVGPGSIEQRLDNLYWRFDTWFYAAFHDGVSNDALPFNVLVLGITWLGVFLFAWSVFRWHNAWIGLIPGGVALFIDLAFVGDSLGGAALLYYLFGFLLIMRTNLVSRMAQWRATGADYPQLISFTFLNFSFWALLALITAAWVAPTGPFSTPGVVRSVVIQVEDIGVDFVRLAGPLRSNKIVPVHNYTAVLPFQGSVRLGDREILAVRMEDQDVQGPFALRGTTYDTYESGGWKAGERQDVPLSGQAVRHLNEGLESGDVEGNIITMDVQITAKTVAGTVLFTVGNPLRSDPTVTARVPAGSLRQTVVVDLPDDGKDLTDQEVFDYLPEYMIGARVERREDGSVQWVEAFDARDQAVPDTVILDPGRRLRRNTGYQVTSFVPSISAEDLRGADRNYPQWVRDQYGQLPEDLPDRVAALAQDTAVRTLEASGVLPPPALNQGSRARLRSAPAYDIAKAIEDYLRTAYRVDYRVEDTPPGRDTVDYFLFESRRGYFDYHASAMVVMLRSLDIPARLAVGYVVDEPDFDSEQGAYVVKDKNTYAWAEVYFPGYGWVMFNPTPDRDEDLYPDRISTTLPENGGIDLSDFGDLPVTADPLFDVGRQDIAVQGGPVQAPGVSGGNPATNWVMPLLLGFMALVTLAVAMGWRRAVAGMPIEQSTWEKVVRLSSLAGHPLAAGETPMEYANGLQKVFRGLRGVSVVASAYNRSRFGRRAANAEEQERIRQLWPGIRGELLRAIGARILRRGRTGPTSYLD